MSKILVTVDYGVIGTILKGLKAQTKNWINNPNSDEQLKAQMKSFLNWIDELMKILDKAVAERKRPKSDNGAWP